MCRFSPLHEAGGFVTYRKVNDCRQPRCQWSLFHPSSLYRSYSAIYTEAELQAPYMWYEPSGAGGGDSEHTAHSVGFSAHVRPPLVLSARQRRKLQSLQTRS